MKLPNSFSSILILIAFAHFDIASAQSSTAKKKILVDVAHGQRFVHDPDDMAGADAELIDRAKYIAGEITKNADALNAVVVYQKKKFTPASLKDVDVLFLQGVGVTLDENETKAIRDFVEKGGGLFVTMDEDYWGTLDKLNINEIVKPFGIEYKQNNPDRSSGGYANAGDIAKERWSIPVHGARIVEGGTPFCYINADESKPFGVYKEINNGGRIVAMGDGMSSLYMNQWENVDNYQCSQFMQDVLGWLIK
jgi:hypothetical protein